MTDLIPHLIVAASAVATFVCLCKAMKPAARPRPPRPIGQHRPAGAVVWVDPGPVDPDAPWRDPEAVPGGGAA